LCRQAKQAKKFQIVLVLQSQILIYYCVGKQSELKISNSTCLTKSNSNILLCRQAKQAKKFQMLLVLPSQILIYYCVGKQSKLKYFK
jgi:hypothetical protein